MEELGDKLDPSEPAVQGVLLSRCGSDCVPFMEGKKSITHSDAVRAVLEGRPAVDFFRILLGGEVLSFDYKWLRAVPRDGFTGAHVDNVYMGRGTERLLTMWTPVGMASVFFFLLLSLLFCLVSLSYPPPPKFGDASVAMGTLAMLHLSKDERAQPVFRKFIETYGSMDVEAEHLQGTGWFTTDPLELQQLLGGHWRTANFRAGDVLIFNMHQPHMSTSNTTRLARISCDTRWQLAADKVGDDLRPLLSPSHSQIILSLFPFFFLFRWIRDTWARLLAMWTPSLAHTPRTRPRRQMFAASPWPRSVASGGCDLVFQQTEKTKM